MQYLKVKYNKYDYENSIDLKLRLDFMRSVFDIKDGLMFLSSIVINDGLQCCDYSLLDIENISLKEFLLQLINDFGGVVENEK